MTRISGNAMLQEIRDIPDVLQRLLSQSQQEIFAAAEHIQRINPYLVTTIGRGSSDHAASYLQYAIELSTGIPVASIGPSVNSIYGVDLHLEKTLNLSISQSGKSPDIVEMTRSARRNGSLTIAVTNDINSPLAATCEHPLNIQAGEEKSVAATKTCVTSIVTGLLLLAYWKKDTALLSALKQIPEQADLAIGCNWQPLHEKLLDNPSSLFVLGRGPSWAIANEAALKFKETCQIHAESYSSAEVMHGPVSIVRKGFPLLVLAARDAAENSVVTLADHLSMQGANVFITSDKASHGMSLPYQATGHAITDPLMQLISFYAFIEKLTKAKGLNPDVPPNLKKVTETI